MAAWQQPPQVSPPPVTPYTKWLNEDVVYIITDEDRGRIYIIYGPPDEIDAQRSGSTTVTYPFEQWRYRRIDSVGTNVIIEFVDPTRTGEYGMTRDPSQRPTR